MILSTYVTQPINRLHSYDSLPESKQSSATSRYTKAYERTSKSKDTKRTNSATRLKRTFRALGRNQLVHTK